MKVAGGFTLRKTPAFVLRMHVRDLKLIKLVKKKLKLREKVHVFNGQKNDGRNRGDQAAIIVRDAYDLKNKVVLFFYGRLVEL